MFRHLPCSMIGELLWSRYFLFLLIWYSVCLIVAALNCLKHPPWSCTWIGKMNFIVTILIVKDQEGFTLSPVSAVLAVGVPWTAWRTWAWFFLFIVFSGYWPKRIALNIVCLCVHVCVSTDMIILIFLAYWCHKWHELIFECKNTL